MTLGCVESAQRRVLSGPKALEDVRWRGWRGGGSGGAGGGGDVFHMKR